MSNETEQTETTCEKKSSGLDFAGVIAKFKDLGKFLSLDGNASRGEYWATFLILWLPLALLSGVFTTLALVLDPKDLPGLLSYPMTLFIGLSSAFLMFANLAMFPVMVRRLHEAKLSVWLAVGCFALAAVPFPWFGYAGAIVVLAAGAIPPKADADGTPAIGIAEKAKMTFLVALLFVFAAAMSGSMMAYFTERRQSKNFEAKCEEGAKDLQKELEKQSEDMKKDMEKTFGRAFDDDDDFKGRGKKKRSSGWGSMDKDDVKEAAKAAMDAAKAVDYEFGSKADDSGEDLASEYERCLRKINKEMGGAALSESELRAALKEFKKMSPREQREMISKFR